MSCPDHEQFHRLVRGSVSANEKAALQLHLDQCEVCHEQLISLVQQTGVVRSTPLGTEPTLQAGFRGPEAPTLATNAPDVLHVDAFVGPPSMVMRDAAPLSTGEVVDSYMISELLGRGGMGDVYLASDASLGREVALKFIRPDRENAERAVARFSVEAKAMARFSHPNIVTIYGAGAHRGVPYVALEYIRGETLRERMRSTRVSLPEAIRIAHDIACGVAEAHRHGVIHRDLKPDNVVIGKDGRARVLDFGLAMIFGQNADRARSEEEPPSVAAASAVMGTPRYMSPEQWRGEPLSGGTDVWALGMIIYELCTGIRPYQADSIDELALLVTAGKPPESMRRFADVPHALDELVARCMHQTSEMRPSASVVASALSNVLSPVSPVSEPMASLNPAASLALPTRTNSVGRTAAFGLAFAALFAAGGAVAFSLLGPEAPARQIMPAPRVETMPPQPAALPTDLPQGADCDAMLCERHKIANPRDVDIDAQLLVAQAMADKLMPGLLYAGFEGPLRKGAITLMEGYSGVTFYFSKPKTNMGAAVKFNGTQIEANLQPAEYNPIEPAKCTWRQAVEAAAAAGMALDDPEKEVDVRYYEMRRYHEAARWYLGYAMSYEVDATDCSIITKPDKTSPFGF